MPDNEVEPNIVEQVSMATRMLEAIAPYIPKHAVGLEIIGADVQYATYSVNSMLISGYALLITARGFLIGPQYNITNAHVIAPFIPNKEQAQEMVHISLSRLREAKAAQSTTKGGARG